MYYHRTRCDAHAHGHDMVSSSTRRRKEKKKEKGEAIEMATAWLISAPFLRRPSSSFLSSSSSSSSPSTCTTRLLHRRSTSHLPIHTNNNHHHPVITAVVSDSKREHIEQTSPHPQPQADPLVFDWYEQWYPVSLLTDLDVNKPQSFTVLGTSLVIWRSKNLDKWNVHLDRCPHRGVPLSEGRLEDTNCGQVTELQCKYHGWQFNSLGECTLIPQDRHVLRVPPKQCAIRRFRATEHDGILFVYMGHRQEPTPLNGDIDMDMSEWVESSTYSRKLPIRFTTLVQNVLDPAHVHFAHHGSVGRRERAGSVGIELQAVKRQTEGEEEEEGRYYNEDGFKATYYDGEVRAHYKAPCVVQMHNVRKGLLFRYYVTPGVDGECTTFATSYRLKRKHMLRLRVPRWMDHMRRNGVIEEDVSLLVSQDGCHSKWAEYKLASGSDAMVSLYRAWLKMYLPPGVLEWYGSSSEEQGKRERVTRLSTRYEGHTKQCSSCSKALRVANAVQVMALCTGAVSMALMLVEVGRTVGSDRGDMTAAMVSACACVCVWIGMEFGMKRQLK